MQSIPRSEIMKRFQSLPESLQEMIFSDKLGDTIKKNCALRDVDNDKMPTVGRLSTRVLLGYLRPELFALEIQKETGIDMEKAQLVARDLDTEIFSAVRLELKKLYPPTIQTPTVQSWKAESQPNLQPTTYNLQPKPRYVIPIPEKFLRPETQNMKLETSDQKPANQSSANQSDEVGFPTTGILSNPTSSSQRQIAKEITGGQAAEARPQASGSTTLEKPQENLQPTTYNLQPNSQPDFKPIVPLPTFIQTQFKPAQKPAETAGQEKEQKGMIDDPNIKSFVDRFKTSQTQKPKPPAENPYREKV